MSQTVKELTLTEFDNAIATERAVLVDFWAIWCGPCKMLRPTIDEIAEEYDGKIDVYSVDVDEEPDLAARFGVMSIPTVAAFKGGELIGKIVGVRDKDEYVDMLELNEE
jgi:thioredoxin 1